MPKANRANNGVVEGNDFTCDTPTFNSPLALCWSAFAWPKAENAHDPIEIIIPIIVNFNPASFPTVLDRYPRAKFLLQSVL
jgi:hypothetical protein